MSGICIKKKQKWKILFNLDGRVYYHILPENAKAILMLWQSWAS